MLTVWLRVVIMDLIGGKETVGLSIYFEEGVQKYVIHYWK